MLPRGHAFYPSWMKSSSLFSVHLTLAPFFAFPTNSSYFGKQVWIAKGILVLRACLENCKVNNAIDMMLYDLQKHLETCSKTHFACENANLGCRAKLMRMNYKTHIKNDCKFRPQLCDKCKQPVPKSHMKVKNDAISRSICFWGQFFL